MRYFAICGGAYAGAWFGNPWWRAAINAWAEETPPPPAEHLDLALDAPNLLDEDGIDWLMEANYAQPFSAAIRRWQLEHGAEEGHLGGGLWFPPGVPELPRRLR
ncbi:hypothetical protein [Tenggerimyces flavus]|uniref:Uncharacterized protein n=1 Tax=Tenggerimyces flavus TaxID=1708749 RepID=A0ABV7YPQ0_9ACTN|nr:hypothetical protein [Tenggerimyces flavus]MBM7790141.1 hypothetical protein [Tenggerimyces flavus]